MRRRWGATTLKVGARLLPARELWRNPKIDALNNGGAVKCLKVDPPPTRSRAWGSKVVILAGPK
jgi:hypothetical protein